MADKAEVRATVIAGATTCTHVVDCSTDLPAEALGEAAALALEKAWRCGVDPVNAVIVLTFK